MRDALGTLSSVRGPSAFADGALTKLDYKFASKVLALGEDVVMDVVLHGDKYVPSTISEQSPSSSSSSPTNGEEESNAVLTANR